MAKKITIVDDLTGANGAEEYTFALNGQTYEIDLVPGQLEEALAPFVEVAKAVRSSVVRARPAPVETERNNTIRRWANETGVPCPQRGRIPERVRAAFDAAHQ